MSELNNARLNCFGRFLVVIDYSLVDAQQKIWKGTPVIDESMTRTPSSEVFFSRTYDYENSDLDRICPKELEIKNESIIGVKFLLIPREKIIFGYEPSSVIAKPLAKIVSIAGARSGQ